MVRIDEGRTIEYKTAPKVHIDFPENVPDILDEANLRTIRELVRNFTSDEVRCACEEFIRKYPNVYFDVFIKEYTIKAAKLDIIKNVYEGSIKC